MSNPFFTEAEMRRLREPPSAPAERYSLTWFRKENPPLYIFGCGNLASMVMERFRGLDIRGFVDNNPAKHGITVYGLPVFSPGAAVERIGRNNGIVIIGIFDEIISRSVESQCRALKLEHVHFHDTIPIPEGVACTPDFADNPDVIGGMELWDEEKSRRMYRDLIRFRITLRPSDRPEVFAPQYFIEEIPAANLRRFVDAGAFDGDTLRTYLALFGGNFDSYHAFEPLAGKRPRLLESVAGASNIHVMPYALSDSDGVAMATDDGCDSRLSDGGDIKIDVRRLDGVFDDVRVGCIKMDIEGMEPEALRGAERTIRRERPALAISVYHRPEHLYGIPRWIRELDLGYRLLLRHHTRVLAETVCYALPA